MGQCIAPFRKKDTTIDLPCGKCLECKKRRVSGWSFRLMKEYERSLTAHFVTLTYNTDHVPITPKGFMSITKRDIQLFFKRLRKLSPQHKIKYYACGEYGGKTFRPHYHIILFNADIDQIQFAWSLGEIHVGEVNEASVGYTLKYISKPSKVPIHKNDDRCPEFALMSKKMGDNYLSKNMIKWHKKDINNRMYVPLKGGQKIAMPRYYKQKIYSDLERQLIGYNINLQEQQKWNQMTHMQKIAEMQKMVNIAIEKDRLNKKDARLKTTL